MANLNWQAQNENGDNLFPITYAENVLKPDGSAATDAVYYEDVGEQTGVAMSPILHQSDVVDNLTTTSTTAPLSAKQGKLLNDDVTSLNSTLASIKNYTFTRQTIPIKTKIALGAHAGAALGNLLTTLPSVTAPSGYSFVSNLYMEISGAVGLTVIFDTVANIGTQTNINGYAFNSNTTALASGTIVNVIIVSVWKKN